MDFKELVAEWNGGEAYGSLLKLSKECGVPPNYLSQYAQGIYIPEGERLAAIAKALKMKPAEIVAAAKASKEKRNKAAHVVRESSGKYEAPQIPVLGVVNASRFSFSYDTFPEEHLPLHQPPGKNLFSLRISEVDGDCLEGAGIKPGDYIIFSKEAQPMENKVVLAQFDGEWTLKILSRNKKTGGLELRPENPKYAAIPITSNKLKIEAVGIGSYRKF